MKARVALLTTMALLACHAAIAGPGLEQIMADPDWIGNQPEGAYWSDSGEAVFFQQKRRGERIRDWYRVSVDGGEIQEPDARGLTGSSNASRVYNADRTRVAWIYEGDVWSRELPAGEPRQLTATAGAESEPLFMAAGDRLAYVSDGDYRVYEFDTGLIRQLAELRLEKEPEDDSEFDELHDQQMRTYGTLREDKRLAESLEKHEEEVRRADARRTPLPVYLGADLREVARSLSPSGRHMILVVESEKDEPGPSGKMPNYVTESGYTTISDTRSRVNRNPSAGQDIFLVDLQNGSFEKLDQGVLPGIKKDPLRKIRKEAIQWHIAHGADKEQVEEALKAPDQRTLTLDEISWNASGSQVLLQLVANDFKDRWMATVDFENSALVPQHRLTDHAWINWAHNQHGWMPGGKAFWFLSEESGYSHLYLKSIHQKKPRQLTRGAFVVNEPQVDSTGTYFYVRANRTHPGNYEVYRLPATGGELRQLTTLGGVNNFSLSPDGRRLLITHSYIDRHPDLFVQDAEAGADPLRLTDTVSEEYKAISWVIPEIVEVPSSHVDRPIYSKLYLPSDYDPARQYPAVMFVHGAGYTQNAHMGWPYYFREFMFHTLLTENGYIVLDMDYRASKGYGREWRAAIYRNMGHPELEDLADGVEFIVKNYNVDRDRVGIYGGSYGGFMTFMALFRAPDLFAAGAALRPVVDWRHYNHSYTSRILNTPEVDPMAFERSSPIGFAEGLRKPLLIAAGMQDDNVFFQDSVMLVQRLIELQKEDFEIAIYPLDPHGFVHADSWLDEYRRIFKLMQRHVKSE
ncbi:MAG: prolyl oligopeptidase family serine peptidase [Gammaproteobacteria bacterium]|nr:prolyl oligopeptidase family serine peptidase [Gammaproteobacteria bacterium]